LKFKNPVLPAAGPVVRDAESAKECLLGGAGGIVAKTISVKPAKVPRPTMALIDRGKLREYLEQFVEGKLVRRHHVDILVMHGFLNVELWSDIPYEQWLEKEYKVIRELCNDYKVPFIASIGYSPEELAYLGPLVQKAGADAIEFSTHYVGLDIKPIIEAAKALREAVEVPIFAKVSPHIHDVWELSRELEKVGVDGIVAINTLGPVLHVDIETARPILGGKDGYGWLSGPSIKPLAVRIVSEVARAVKIPVIGVGGITTGRDVIEFFMVGASAVQVCTAAIVEGPSVFKRLNKEVEEWLRDHGYSSLEDVKGVALKHLPKEPVSLEAIPPNVDAEKCTGCGLCEKHCIYKAIKVQEVEGKLLAVVDEEKCYGCGLCVSLCPMRALSIVKEG